MNPLEKIKEQLRLKPTASLKQEVKVSIPVPTLPEKVSIQNVQFKDEQDPNYPIAELLKQLSERNVRKVVTKQTVELSKPLSAKVGKEAEAKKPDDKPAKKAKKISKKALLVLQEEGVSILPEAEAEDEEKEEAKEEAKEEVTEKKAPAKKKASRKTTKQPKGISTLDPIEWISIDEKAVATRLPKKKQNVIYKVSSYYMNNREIFINFINSLFEPYRDQVLDDSAEVTCDTIGSVTEEFSLLTHQKIVRDYLNLYTPYRGLLLYHGLGSGKTCTSIAIAEGMKSSQKIIVMTPASLRRNYIEELKKCGDALYKKQQFWQWIDDVEAIETLSSALSLPMEFIRKKGGAWLVDVSKPSNYDELETAEKTSLDEQLDEMIMSKYKFINYNGLRREKLREMTSNFENNIFDNAVIVIDEAHNFISRIVNKIGKEKEVSVNEKTGKRERLPFSLSIILYEMLLSAQNARIVLLTGTPIINYPNEIGILYNILRGYIKTWEIPLDVKTGKPTNKESLKQMFSREKNMDFMDYSASSKKLIFTRNPFGFESRDNKDGAYEGVTNKDLQKVDKATGEKVVYQRGQISDEDFERRVIQTLHKNEIEVIPQGISVRLFKALPDKFDDFLNLFINGENGTLKNVEMFKHRIMGLTSYFRSAQEKLLPRYEKIADFHVVKIAMSDYQFGVYEAARQQERKQETQTKKKKGKVDENGIYQEPSSTYRIFSRLFCNFVMPKPPGRPMPREDTEEGSHLDELYKEVLKETEKVEPVDLEGDDSGEVEGDIILDKLGDATYEMRIKRAIDYVKEHSSEYLSPAGLETYSPKYLHILENIQDPEHIGLHLVYSQFRTLEGIGIFTMVLEQNGFTRFKIKKNSSGEWELDIAEEDLGKPTFALYTGTETAEEKEVIRNIFNGDWPKSTPLTERLKLIAENNNMGEIIKVLMITASGSEGINLRNTRYVHIMEPYWHPARIEQVVGRARRICSHKNLPEELQTVEVYLYLMTFTKEQILSDASIELKRKDLSKKAYPSYSSKDKDKLVQIPFTSDEALFEISTIKDEVSQKLITAMKEASIDCAIYSREGSKEQLHCLQFGQPNSNTFSYQPSYKSDQPDTTATINKKSIEWSGKEVQLKGKTYIYRKMSAILGNIYDLDSYKQALQVPGVEPVLIGTLEKLLNGNMQFKKI
uniref:Helicase ATP-binding domain-containing protein n=1 Tax=viral metagenome TaxID=1070528 RepID=A0A6C0BBB6_9ZZZZ